MENITTFIVPDIANTKAKKVAKKKPTKEIIEERARLPRTNRTIPCAFCHQDKTLNPDQYQARYDFWGDEDKLQREFQCKECDMSAKTNPVRFWLEHSELLYLLTRKVRAAFEVFNASSRGNDDVVALQNMVNSFLSEVHIDPRLAVYGTEPFAQNKITVKTLKLNNIPFVGTITLQPYENTEHRIKFE
jgi:hypothetical protein